MGCRTIAEQQRDAAATLHHFWDLLRADHTFTEEQLDEAREAFMIAAPDEQRAAYWAFRRRRVMLADEMPPPIAARFSLGDDEPIIVLAGWDSGQTWNGWRVPLVEADQVTEFVKVMTDDVTPQRTFAFDGDVLLVVDNADDPEARESFEVEGIPTMCADGQTRHLFDLSLGLIWEHAREPAAETDD